MFTTHAGQPSYGNRVRQGSLAAHTRRRVPPWVNITDRPTTAYRSVPKEQLS
ncbi:hypothetical protein [Mycolicibacterium llatzerense]|uniref:hypothetical protein n=1 Tax=Mycolicibacterium llatzerense TaxID=280871 RepID=UPI0031D78879